MADRIVTLELPVGSSVKWKRGGEYELTFEASNGWTYTFNEYVDDVTLNGDEWPEGENVTISRDVDGYTATLTLKGLSVAFYECTAERDRVDKTAYLTTMFTQSGHLRDACEITAPVIVFEYPGGQMPLFNYVYIPRLHRYYYLEKLVIIDTGLYEMYLKVDVLNTYKDTIKAQSGIVARNQYDYDTDITDSQRALEAEPHVVRLTPGSRNASDIVQPLPSGESIDDEFCYVATVICTDKYTS